MSLFSDTNHMSRILFRLMTALAVFSALALSPARAGTIPDNEDGPYSDDLTQVAQPAVIPGTNQLAPSDATFANLFTSWRKLDDFGSARPAVYIPSGRPVEKLALTSNYGVRSDPFNGRARMHRGVDIPGPVGTPIYATADGIVSRSEWASGYGNLVEIAHGNDMATRYGHMSKLLVTPNQRVRRGQMIGLMGSTGRSTGSHLHYEIRIAGAAINPTPFIVGTERALALNSAPTVAMGGPAPADEAKVK